MDNNNFVPMFELNLNAAIKDQNNEMPAFNIEIQGGAKGLQGERGQPGQNGENGQDGFSPTAVVEQGDNSATITITDKNGTTSATIEGGSSGTSDYADLSNKPKINNVELSGNKTTSDLGLFSGNYNDLSNKPTIPMVNNSTITIQKNSTTVDSFTTNADSNKTINISVPTTTSDLTNNSGFIDNTYHDNTKQDTLVSGTNIKTINNESILGSGNLEIKGIDVLDISTDLLTAYPSYMQNGYYEGEVMSADLIAQINQIVQDLDNSAKAFYFWIHSIPGYALLLPQQLRAIDYVSNFGFLGSILGTTEQGKPITVIIQIFYDETDEKWHFRINDINLLAVENLDKSINSSSLDNNAPTSKAVYDAIAALGTVFTLKGSVAAASNLPSQNNNVGDVYYVEDVSSGYVWIDDNNTERWEELGPTIDTSNFLTKTGLEQATGNSTTNTMSQKAITDAIPTATSDLNNDSGFIDNTVDNLVNYFKKADGTLPIYFINSSNYDTSNTAFDFSEKEPGLYIIRGNYDLILSNEFYIKPRASANALEISLGYTMLFIYISSKIPNTYVEETTHRVVCIGRNNISVYGIKDKNNKFEKMSSYGDTFANLSSAQTITGVKTFSALPKSSITPTDDDHLTRKGYVDDKVLDVYSTSETNTNKVWIDNKPIYRKVYHFDTLPDSAQTGIPHGLSISSAIRSYGVVHRPSDNQTFNIPFKDVDVWFDKDNVWISTGQDRSNSSADIVIEYTKTTD